jgi:hypothetical protein
MSYQKDRDEFIGVIVEECQREDAQATYRANVPPEKRRDSAVDLARLILRNAATIQHHAINLCNREVSAAEQTAAQRAKDRIEAACEPWGIKPNFGGDPRGCCVKLLLPSGRWNSFGGREVGFCVPIR